MISKRTERYLHIQYILNFASRGKWRRAWIMYPEQRDKRLFARKKCSGEFIRRERRNICIRVWKRVDEENGQKIVKNVETHLIFQPLSSLWDFSCSTAVSLSLYLRKNVTSALKRKARRRNNRGTAVFLLAKYTRRF